MHLSAQKAMPGRNTRHVHNAIITAAVACLREYYLHFTILDLEIKAHAAAAGGGGDGILRGNQWC